MMTQDWMEGLWTVALVAAISTVYCPLLCWLLASRTTQA